MKTLNRRQRTVMNAERKLRIDIEVQLLINKINYDRDTNVSVGTRRIRWGS